MEKAEKNSFVLYTDYQQHIALLTDEEAGQLFKALFEFVKAGTSPPFDGSLAMCFSFISSQIQRDKEKYLDICSKRAAAGRMGGKQKQANLANANSVKQKQAKLTDTVTDTVTENVTDTEKNIMVNEVDRICELLNKPREYKGGNAAKGKLKPKGFFTWCSELLNIGISYSNMLRLAEELADDGKIVDWYEFSKMLKQRKAAENL